MISFTTLYRYDTSYRFIVCHSNHLDGHKLKVLQALTPIASLKNPMGLLAVLGEALVIMLTGKGYQLLSDEPSVVIPIVLGSVLGLMAFRGIPAGPLVASSLTGVFYSIYKWIEKIFL